MYEVIVPNRVCRRIARLTESAYERVLTATRRLGEEPRPRSSLKMTDRDEHRLPIEDYRVVRAIDDDRGVVTVLQVGHRRDVYR